jgi:hypothetical protein
MLLLSFIEGVGFDPFFRGFLSVVIGVVVLCGAVFLLLSTNSGPRTGFLLAATGLFGWMFLMGLMWTAFGIGWRGPDPVWAPVEINRGDLSLAATEEVRTLDGIDVGAAVPDTITDPDERNRVAVEYAQQIEDDLEGWRLLPPGDQQRGEAQATADALLVELGVFDGPGDFVPLEFGAFAVGGKDRLPPDPTTLDRLSNFFRTTFVQILHPQHLSVIQVQRALDQFVEPGQPPPTPEPDPAEPVVTVVMERDRGGPIPALISGHRFTPFMFTLFSLIVFAVLAAALQGRDKREAEIRAREKV